MTTLRQKTQTLLEAVQASLAHAARYNPEIRKSGDTIPSS